MTPNRRDTDPELRRLDRAWQRALERGASQDTQHRLLAAIIDRAHAIDAEERAAAEAERAARHRIAHRDRMREYRARKRASA